METSPLEYQGASTDAIQYHYDTGNEFYRLWLDPTLTYSCAIWEANDSDDALETAQVRKLEFHAQQARVSGKQAVLEIGCGWGSFLRYLVDTHGVKKAVGLTLSAAQAEWLRNLGDPRIEVRQENWFDHSPEHSYGAVVSIAAFEAFAKQNLSEDEKVRAYRTFFERCHAWLQPSGWMSLQTIAWGNARKEDSSGFIETQIFPESDLPTLWEIIKATEPLFEVVDLRNDRHDYERTVRVWLSRLKAKRGDAVDRVGEDVVDRYEKYLKVAWIGFHTGKINLYRITLRRINETAN